MTAHRRGGPLAYQLHVTASTALDAVHHAGGFMFDLAMAGWKVTVAIEHQAEPAHSAALGILGADTTGAETASASVDAPDPQVRRLVCSAEHSADYQAELFFWDPDLPIGTANDGRTVQYPLSSAARAFKTAALAVAGGLDIAVAPTESFRSDRPPRSCAVCEDEALKAAAD